MRIRTMPVIEVTAHIDAIDGFPLLGYVQEGEDRGFVIAVDIIEAEYTQNTTSGEMMLLTARARGPRVDLTGEGPVYGNTVHWMDLDTSAIPGPVAATVVQMAVRAGEDWLKVRKVK